VCSTESGCRYGTSCKFVHSSGDEEVVARDDAGLSHGAGDSAVGGVETAMAGLSMVADKPQPVTASDNTSASANAADASCPANSVNPASAAAAKCPAWKRKGNIKKKGLRKTKKQESKSKELVLYDHQTVKCGMILLYFPCSRMAKYAQCLCG